MKRLLYLILAVILITTLIPWTSQGVPATDDFRHHLTKFWAVNENVNNFEWNEWQPHIYSGWPLTQFYHSFPYFILLPLNFFFSAFTMLKLNMVAAMILGVASMFYAAKELTKNEQTAIIASIFYALAPIHFEFAYISGSISRQWAYALIPLAFITFIKAVDNKNLKSTIYVSLAFAALMWSHLNVAYAMSIVFALYLVMNYSKFDKKLLKQLVMFSILTLSLLSFWLIPLVAESSESETSNRLSSVFGNAPNGIKPSLIFMRSFGLQPEGRYFYVGVSLLLLAFVSVFAKYKYRNFLVASALLSIILSIFTLPLKLFPYLLIDYSIYFTLIALVPISIMAAYGARALAKLIPIPGIALLILIAIVAIDLYPAMHTYNWVDQPTDNFINPPQLIQVWEEIDKQPGVFRVHSPIGQVPFIYHNKFEVGTTWMGYREGALQPIRQITDQFVKEFESDPLGNKSRATMEYFGVKHLVLQCNPVIEPVYPLQIQGQGVCSYKVDGAPLVSSVSKITKSKEIRSTLQNDEAVIVEDCERNCSITTSKANVSDIDWKAESISFTTNAQQPTYVMIRSAYFSKRHNAYVNNKPTKITQVWPKYMLIQIPENTSKVEIRYESNMTHRFAQLISLLALLFVFFFKKSK